MFSEKINGYLKFADDIFSAQYNLQSIEIILNKLEKDERISLEDAGILLNVSDVAQFNRIINISGQITKKYHGNSIGMIAPLYFSNFCWNDCSSCDMSCKNLKLKRRTLNFEEFVNEFNLLKEVGYKTIEIVAGGFPLKSKVGEMFLKFVEYGKKNVKNFAFFIDTLSLEDYKNFADPKTTMIHWQESYIKDDYFKMVISGPKKDFEKRINAHETYLQAGGKKVGLSVLAGVANNFLKDVFMVLAHGKYLEETYGIPPSCFGTVRINPITRKDVSEFKKIPDEQMYLATALYRIMFPKTNIIITSRENPEIVRRQIEAGATFANTTCTTVIGGYKLMKEGKLNQEIGQFDHGNPSPEEVKKSLESIGKIMDWDKEL